MIPAACPLSVSIVENFSAFPPPPPRLQSLVSSSSSVYGRRKKEEEGGMVAILLNAFTCHGSGLASLSRNLIKTFNIREIPDADGTPSFPPPSFDSIRFNAFPGYVLHDTFLSTFIYEVNAYSRILFGRPTIFPRIFRSLRSSSEKLIVNPHGRRERMG